VRPLPARTPIRTPRRIPGRTTGESVDDLDVTQFVETLREKRAQIMKQIPVRDVQFKLAFHNGKAAIRYLTVT
jgi:hypothetical protein